MPASVTASSIQDVTTFYLENFMAKTWEDASRGRQHYITADELFTQRRKRAPASEKCTWNYKVNSADNTVPDSFFKADSLNRIDLGQKGEVKWHFQKTHFMVDAREPAMLSGSELQILDYLKMQESDMYDGFFEKNETWFWTLPTAPNDGTSGDPLPFGLPYWLVQSSTAAFGFNGGHPTGYTTVGGLSRTTYPKLKNGTFTYASMSSEDFGRKMSEAIDKCHFQPPKPMGENVPSRSSYKLYSGYKAYQDYQDALFAANDNIGTDLGKYRGGAPNVALGQQHFRNIPWIWVPALTEVGGDARDLNEPVYGVNWDTFAVKSYHDFFMKRTKPIVLDDAHNTVVQWMDTGYQIYCTSPRSNFVGRAATASAS